MNKYESAYNMLMILMVVDGEFNSNEGDVIIDYLRSAHENYVGTKDENKTFMELSNDQLLDHFRDASYEFYKKHSDEERLNIFESAAKDYYAQSLHSDRVGFIEFAKQIIIADHKVTKLENTYINKLFDLWGMQ
ncbi:MAG: TerB family tellurite resistance protein [Bacteroidia bacterium]